MKKYFLFMSLLTLLVGCDAPQRTRAPSTWVNGNSLENPSNTSGNFSPSNSSGSNGGSTTTPSNVNSSPGFESCDLSSKYHTMDVGHFGVCQSTQDETAFKFRTDLTSTTVRTCLIPTYKEASGASTYIGNPQCTFTTSNQVVSGKLYKDRSGFSSYPLNGVIVMKEPLLPEYISCMQGYVNWPGNVCASGPTNSYCAYWLPLCPYGGRSNANCDQAARAHMSNLCNTFKSKYSNSYIDIKTR